MGRAQEVGKIERMKDLWSKHGLSPRQFFDRFFTKYSDKSYQEFLEMINFDDNYSFELQKAVEDLKREKR
jgi:hypothetical protein